VATVNCGRLDVRTVTGRSSGSAEDGIDPTTLGDDVFVGPNAVFTNDPYPIRVDVELTGATVEDHVSVGANATIMPGVTLGEGCFVAGGAVVTRDVPPRTLALGAPAEHRPLPEPLRGDNVIA